MILIILIIFLLYIKFYPEGDTLPNGDWIVWYNAGGNYHKSRKYFILKRKK